MWALEEGLEENTEKRVELKKFYDAKKMDLRKENREWADRLEKI